MNPLRRYSALKRWTAGAALVAVLLHALLLSLHVTAGFERALSALSGDGLTGSVHAFCGPGDPAAAITGGDGGGQSGLPNCPICTGAVAAAAFLPPAIDVASVEFAVDVVSYSSIVHVVPPLRAHRHAPIRAPPFA